MPRYHITPKDGKARTCSAVVKCLYGSLDREHFDTPADASVYLENVANQIEARYAKMFGVPKLKFDEMATINPYALNEKLDQYTRKLQNRRYIANSGAEGSTPLTLKEELQDSIFHANVANYRKVVRSNMAVISRQLHAAEEYSQKAGVENRLNESVESLLAKGLLKANTTDSLPALAMHSLSDDDLALIYKMPASDYKIFRPDAKEATNSGWSSQSDRQLLHYYTELRDADPTYHPGMGAPTGYRTSDKYGRSQITGPIKSFSAPKMQSLGPATYSLLEAIVRKRYSSGQEEAAFWVGLHSDTANRPKISDFAKRLATIDMPAELAAFKENYPESSNGR